MSSPYSLVWHNGALGDGIVSLPAIEVFVRSAGHPVFGLGTCPALPLMVERGVLQGLRGLSLSEQLQIYAKAGPLPELLLESERSLVFAGPRGLDERLRSALGEQIWELRLPGCYKFGEPPLDASPACEQLLKQLPLSRTTDIPAWPRLPSRPGAGPGLLIHPGAGGRGKIWPAERWLELALELRSWGLEPSLALGPVERERGWPAAKARELGLNLLYPSSVVELAREIEARSIFVAQDSGPSHLAAALGCRVFVLFGDSCAEVWGPRAEPNRVSILQAPGGRLEELRVAVVKDFLEMSFKAASWLR